MFLILFFLFSSLDIYFISLLKFKLFLLTTLFFNIIFFIICISELSRSPIDFLEGESELVSGFNLEFIRFPFSLIFVIEYGFLILISILLTSFIFYNLIFFFIIALFILTRISFPRIRFDYILKYFWKEIVLIVLIFYFTLFFV